jgi:hypothetical protein
MMMLSTSEGISMKTDCITSKILYQLASELEDTAMQLGNMQRNKTHADFDVLSVNSIN